MFATERCRCRVPRLISAEQEDSLGWKDAPRGQERGGRFVTVSRVGALLSPPLLCDSCGWGVISLESIPVKKSAQFSLSNSNGPGAVLGSHPQRRVFCGSQHCKIRICRTLTSGVTQFAFSHFLQDLAFLLFKLLLHKREDDGEARVSLKRDTCTRRRPRLG